MSITNDIVKKLNKKGFTNLKFWSKFGIERIYWSNAPGYFEIINNKDLKIIKLDYLTDIINEIKKELKNASI